MHSPDASLAGPTPHADQTWSLSSSPTAVSTHSSIQSSRGPKSSTVPITCAGEAFEQHPLDVDALIRTDTPWWKPLSFELQLYGVIEATKKAENRFLKQAFQAIYSGSGFKFHRCSAAPRHLQVRLDFAILSHDILGATSEVQLRFTQYLVFIALNLLECYDSDTARVLLGKGLHDVLEWFRAFLLSEEPNMYPIGNIIEATVDSTVPKSTRQFHFISLFRLLLEYSGGKKDCWQHRLYSEYTANNNANIYGSVLGIHGPGAFGSFNPQEMFQALSNSSLFSSITTPQHTTQLSEGLIANLDIGFREGYLGLPAKVLCGIGLDEVHLVRVQIDDLCRQVPVIQSPADDTLIFLACSLSLRDLPRIVKDWAASDKAKDLYRRLINDIQEPQPITRLGLALAALLGYSRLLPDRSHNTVTYGTDLTAYLTDFNALLFGQPVRSRDETLQRMVLSIFRTFAVSGEYEDMYKFLATVIDIETPLLAPLDGFSDQYWSRRMKGATHGDAFADVGLLSLTRNESLDKDDHVVRVSAHDLNGQSEAMDVAPCGVPAECASRCGHPNGYFKVAEGSKLSRVILEIQLYDRHFYITVDSLATSWAGRWILLRNGFWIRALKATFEQSTVKLFRLIDTPSGLHAIEGGCCPGPGELSDAELRECILGRILVAEKDREWGRFFVFIWWYLVRHLRRFVRLVLN